MTYLDYTAVDQQSKALEGAMAEDKERINKLEAKIAQMDRLFADGKFATQRNLLPLVLTTEALTDAVEPKDELEAKNLREKTEIINRVLRRMNDDLTEREKARREIG